jgi:hypothetical protein
MRRINLEVEYDIGEIVYVITDEDQRPYTVGSVKVFELDYLYAIFAPGRSYEAYPYELSREKTLQL